MRRREFLRTGAIVAALPLVRGWGQTGTQAGAEEQRIEFVSGDGKWQGIYDAALRTLAGNLKDVPEYQGKVLVEGAEYLGIWMECAPHEGLVYRDVRRDVARNNHLALFARQKEDGQIPANIRAVGTVGWAQIQMVVPIAATAWELAEETGDEELLEKAYVAGAKWDEWLMRYRNTRGTGLVEGFCTYDTGHDNSPRWDGVPGACPDKDARKCPAIAGLPRLCPDLSATTYGGRIALAEMAEALGKKSEAAQWKEKAARIKRLIVEKLYSVEDACFFDREAGDLDANRKYVKVVGDAMIRVLGEHVVDAKMFQTLWERQIHDPKKFWAPYPLPSVAMDDPAFVKRPIPRNTWGGPSQALEALRAPRWMEPYSKHAEMAWMMERWCEAIDREGGFRQQMDPLTGEFTKSGAGAYSPCALVMMDFIWRLGGVRIEGKRLEWNVRPKRFAAGTRFTRKLKSATAEMVYEPDGVLLKLGGREVVRVSGTTRVVTDRSGKILELVGVVDGMQSVGLRGGGLVKTVRVGGNLRVRV